jgi:nitrogen-specific signal transduction histidine kinase/CheY-like chemotaxis protein
MFLQPAVGPDGAIHGISGSFVDITERRDSERKHQRAAASPEVNVSPAVELDADGAVACCNPAAAELAVSLGCVGVEEMLPPDFAGIARRCLETGVGRVQQEVQVNGHVLCWSFFSVAGYPVVHCHGEDVTQTRSAEAHSHQVQKIESLGQLTASAAHDFNNLLTVILGHAQGLLNVVREETPLAQPLEAIAEAARRGAALSRHLALFSRRKEVHPRALDLNTLLGNHSPMLERILGADIALQLELERGLPAVEGDAGLIEQLLMNLAVNARDAMPRGGALLVQTRFLEVSRERASRHPEAQVGPFVCLTLRDSGPGMDADTKARLFDPFFARNDPGKAAGLGLATVYGIVQQHHGWIEVESEPGAGAAFHIFLPGASVEEDGGLAASASASALRGGGESILLVDDEHDLRELLQSVLHQLGYQVQTAGSATEALRLWDEAGGGFDLVVSDVLMPEGMNGRDLADQLVRRAPGLKVILSSGSSPEELGLLSGEARFEFLPKPFVPAAFSRLVRKCLDERLQPHAAQTAG